MRAFSAAISAIDFRLLRLARSSGLKRMKTQWRIMAGSYRMSARARGRGVVALMGEDRGRQRLASRG